MLGYMGFAVINGRGRSEVVATASMLPALTPNTSFHSSEQQFLHHSVQLNKIICLLINLFIFLAKPNVSDRGALPAAQTQPLICTYTYFAAVL